MDKLPSELFKDGREELGAKLLQLIQKIWKEAWNMDQNCSILKKSSRTVVATWILRVNAHYLNNV